MAGIYNEEQRMLLNEKISIIKRMESSDIKESEYDLLKVNLLEIENKLKANIDKFIIDTYKKEAIVKTADIIADNKKQQNNTGENMANEEIKTQPQEVKVAKKVKAAENKPKKITRQSVIIEVLQMKSVRNLETAVAKVCEKIPNSVMNDVKVHINWFINVVKNPKGKYAAKYSWDAANYKLIVKTV